MSTKRNTDTPVGYKTIAQDIERFVKSDICPFRLHSSLTDDEEIVVNLLTKNSAKWHKLCRNKIDCYKYDRAIKRQASSCASGEIPKKLTRLSSGDAAAKIVDLCLFCNSNNGKLRKVSTLEIDQKIRTCALEVYDTVLQAKLSAGDLISQEAQYHLECLSALYYKASSMKKGSSSNTDYSQAHGIAFGEIVAYIEETQKVTDFEDIPILKLKTMLECLVLQMA
jgi:hypothetical protein